MDGSVEYTRTAFHLRASCKTSLGMVHSQVIDISPIDDSGTKSVPYNKQSVCTDELSGQGLDQAHNR